MHPRTPPFMGPIHVPLIRCGRVCLKAHLTFVVSSLGKPYSPDRLGALFARWATAADD
jgi:hypothetical protein